METRSKKRLKVDQCNYVEEEEEERFSELPDSDLPDWISDLPEDCLLHILSFLDIRTACRSSILCKRWRYLWTSLNSLCFINPKFMNKRKQPLHIVKYEEMMQTKRFMESVDKVLKLVRRHKLHNIQSFQLDSYYKCDGGEVTSCLNRVATMHSVKDLRLSVTSATYTSILNTPNFLSGLHQLRVFHFEGVITRDRDWISDVLTNCPLLETLVVIRCQIQNLSKISISSQCLKKLVLIDLVQSLSMSTTSAHRSINIKICAPNVTSLKLIDVTPRCFLKNLRSVEKAEIGIQAIYGVQLNHEWLMKLVNGLSNVKELIIQLGACSLPDSAVSITVTKPILLNLRCLKFKGSCYANCVPVLTYLLKCSTHLETLVMEGKQCLLEDEEEDVEFEKGMLNYVRTVEMENFQATEGELKTLEALLKTAAVLEKVQFKVAERSKHLVNGRMKKRMIANLHHASSSVLLSFIDPKTQLEYKKIELFK